MIEYTLIEKTCPVCGAKSLQKVLQKPSQTDVSFLDGCPFGESFEALPYLAEVCPSCGFAAYNLSNETTVSKKYIDSKEYQGLINPRINEDTSKYARLALISISQKNYPAAVREFLSAAWCADLCYDKEMGVLFRKKALEIQTASGQIEHFSKEIQIGIIDTMRRVGNFDDAQKLALTLIETADDAVGPVLSFELELSSYGIDGAKTSADAVHYAKNKYGAADDTEEYTVSGRTYFASVDGYGTGWHWNPCLRVLTLLSYHGGPISFSGSVTILVENGENIIHDEYGAGISVTGGDLTIISKGPALQIQSSGYGIFTDGKFIADGAVLEITAKDFGISAAGDAVICGSSVSGSSDDVFISSSGGKLFEICGSYINGIGQKVGADIFDSCVLQASVLRMESPKGTGLLIRNGSYSISLCMQTVIGGDFGIRIENGSLLKGTGSNTEVSGNTALYVKEKIELATCPLSAVGKDCGISAGTIHVELCPSLDSMGNVGIKTEGDCILEQCSTNISAISTGLEVAGRLTLDFGRIDAVAESGTGIICGSALKMKEGNISVIGSKIGMVISEGVDMTKGVITASGDTALKISGDLHSRQGIINARGIITGIEIGGSCVWDGGRITVSGNGSFGTQINGEFLLNAGNIETSGKEVGLVTGKNLKIESANITATGKTGCKVGGAMTVKMGAVIFSGSEMGLDIAGGGLTIDGPVLMEASGDVGIFTSSGFSMNAGVMRASGQFCGIVVEKGDAVFNMGVSEITGQEYGMLLQKGSLIQNNANVSVNSDSCGLCIDAGDLIVNSFGISVNGKKYGVTADSGTVILNNTFAVSGGEYAVSSKALRIRNGSLDAVSNKNSGTALITKDISSETEIIFICGGDKESSKETEYDGQSYLHIYPRHHYRLTVSAEMENLELIFKWVEKSLTFCGISPQIISQMMLVTEEFFVNIARYAYPNEKGDADLIMYCGKELRLVISDTGQEFDPLTLTPPDQTTPILERKTGGWGIYLSRKLTDRITYERIDNRNVLTFYKNL
ncbi:MAG: DUF2225 domain-containing protein [Methanocorpusculum sp.]|nr:DUF2225 domain-containing protein [Methanocorpusculum sp.]